MKASDRSIALSGGEQSLEAKQRGYTQESRDATPESLVAKQRGYTQESSDATPEILVAQQRAYTQYLLDSVVSGTVGGPNVGS